MMSIFPNLSLKLRILVAALLTILYSGIFYLDSYILKDHVNLLLPYIVGIIIGTFILGTRWGMFLLILSLSLSFFPRIHGEVPDKFQIVDFVIKATFSLLIYSLVVYLKKLYSMVKEMAISDSLTGLNNKRGFQFLANTILHGAKRNSSLVCCVYLDIDNFKQVNDTKGHKAGDKVLIGLAKVLQENIRESDVCGRIGGDEFCIIILENSKDSITSILHRIQKGFQHFSEKRKWPTTLSIGAYFTRKDYNLASLMRSSDKVMYSAKQKGKNTIEVVEEFLIPQ